ncbi:MAG: hypothetical protein ACJAYF_001106 [Arenicella sp.]|jgi:hypothetical protein
MVNDIEETWVIAIVFVYNKSIKIIRRRTDE